MSVILDALRRSRNRRDGTAQNSPSREVPAALGLAASSASPVGWRPPQTRLLGLGLLLVIGLGAWAVIQVARVLIMKDAPAQSSSASGASVPVTAAAPKAAQPPPSPPANPAESPVVLRSAPDSRSSGQVARPLNERSDDVLNHFQLAVRYQTLGNDDEALKHYRAVLASDASNVQAYNNLGLLYRRRGLTKDAVDQFRRAIAIDPQYVKARSNLSVALMDAGRVSEARAEVRAALAIEPRNADLIVNLALVEQADRHREQAIELLVRALGIQPTNALAHYNLAVLYDEQSEIALAYNHYAEFLKYAGPEHRELLSDVQQRLLILRPKLAIAG